MERTGRRCPSGAEPAGPATRRGPATRGEAARPIGRRRRLGRRGREAGAAAVGTVATGVLLVARLVLGPASLIALLIALAIVLRDVDANSANTIVKGVHEGANFFAGAFTGLIRFSGHPKRAITVDWGIALLVYLIVGAVLSRAIAGIGRGGMRFERANRAVPIQWGRDPVEMVERQLKRVWLPALLAAAMACGMPAAGAQAFAIAKWEAGTASSRTAPTRARTSAFYTQATGHPDFGITDFRFDVEGRRPLPKGKVPEGNVKDVRVDLPPGLAVNPEATGKVQPAAARSGQRRVPAGKPGRRRRSDRHARSVLGQKQTVDRKIPRLQHGPQARPAGALRRGNQQRDAQDWPVLQGHIYLEGGISWHKEAATRRKQRRRKRRLPRVLRDRRHPQGTRK